jgi:hypothetical protein
LWSFTTFALLGTAVFCTACSGPERQLQQRQEKIESLAASATTVANAWLDHSVSSTYARTALDQTFLLLEQERSTLASSPENLIDGRGAQLSQAAERLARTIASIIDDVTRGDPNAARQHLSAVPRP